MSKFTLQETLDFYREITESITPDLGKEVFFPHTAQSTFSSIVDRVKDNSIHSLVSPYTSFPVNFYSKYINQNLHSSYSYKIFPVIITDLLPLFDKDSQNLLIRGYPTAVLSSYIPYQNLSKLLNLIKILETQNINQDKYMIIFSASTGSLEHFHLDSSTSSQDFYIDYLKKNHLLKEVTPICQ